MAGGQHKDSRDLALTLLPRFEAMDDEFYVSITALTVAGISMGMGDIDGAWRWGLRAIVSQHAMGDAASFTLALKAVALLFLAMDRPGEAAMFNAAFEGLCRRHGIRPPTDPSFWINTLPADPETIGRLTDKRYAVEIGRGSQMTVDEALEELLRFARAEGLGQIATAADAVVADGARGAPAIDAAR